MHPVALYVMIPYMNKISISMCVCKTLSSPGKRLHVGSEKANEYKEMLDEIEVPRLHLQIVSRHLTYQLILRPSPCFTYSYLI